MASHPMGQSAMAGEAGHRTHSQSPETTRCVRATTKGIPENQVGQPTYKGTNVPSRHPAKSLG